MTGKAFLFRMILCAALVLTVLASTTPLSAYAGSPSVPVADPALAKAVGEALHKSAEDLTVEDVSKVTALYAYQNKNIRSLSGLEHAVNMGILILDGNPIEDFTPLATLTKVRMLALSKTGIQDLAPLVPMKSLNKLLLTGNRIADLSPLRNSSALTDLLLENNEITDVTALEGLKNLTWLNLSGNRISDISALAHLTALENLYLGNNSISNISPLLNLRKLKKVELTNNPLSAETAGIIAALRGRGVAVEGVPAELPRDMIKIKIDDMALPFTLSQAPFIEEDTTMVPFRPVFEQLGLAVGWDGASGTVVGTKGRFTISLQIGSKTAYVNGKPTELAAAPRIDNDSTFVPVRFVAEATGRKVEWQESSKTVSIRSTFQSTVNETLYSDNLKYEGETLNGLPHGSGIYSLNGTVWYKGHFVAGKMEGDGLMTDIGEPASCYEGEFLNNLPDGHGKMVYSGGSYYAGNFAAGNRHGTGKLYNKDGSIHYEGQFQEDAITGFGTLYSDTGIRYTGRFINGLMFGPFKEYKGEELIYEGEYQGSYREGTGKEYDGGKLVYEGEYMFGKRGGQGKLYHEGKLWYEGDVEDYTLNGNGKIYYQDDSCYTGQVYEGKANGTGVLYAKDGSKLKEGFFFQDQWQANPDQTKETVEYRLFDLHRSVIYYVTDGMNHENEALKPTQAIMELAITGETDYGTYLSLSTAERLDFMNQYAQSHWGDMVGVQQCFIIITYEGDVVQGTVTSYQQTSDKLKLVTAPRALDDF